jgi:hypothetical protein
VSFIGKARQPPVAIPPSCDIRNLQATEFQPAVAPVVWKQCFGGSGATAVAAGSAAGPRPPAHDPPPELVPELKEAARVFSHQKDGAAGLDHPMQTDEEHGRGSGQSNNKRKASALAASSWKRRGRLVLPSDLTDGHAGFSVSKTDIGARTHEELMIG